MCAEGLYLRGTNSQQKDSSYLDSKVLVESALPEKIGLRRGYQSIQSWVV